MNNHEILNEYEGQIRDVYEQFNKIYPGIKSDKAVEDLKQERDELTKSVSETKIALKTILPKKKKF